MNNKSLIARTTVTFIPLAIAGIMIAVGSKTMVDPVDQLILIAVGSALFGAALSFFLVRIYSLAER